MALSEQEIRDVVVFDDFIALFEDSLISSYDLCCLRRFCVYGHLELGRSSCTSA